MEICIYNYFSRNCNKKSKLTKNDITQIFPFLIIPHNYQKYNENHKMISNVPTRQYLLPETTPKIDTLSRILVWNVVFTDKKKIKNIYHRKTNNISHLVCLIIKKKNNYINYIHPQLV